MTRSSRGKRADPDEIVQRVAAFAAEHSLIPRRGRIVVAVSGGADSRCLLDILARLVPRPRDRLLVAHVDHQLRPDSAEDARFVADLAAASGLLARVERVGTRDLARARRIGIEHAARVLRYSLLGAIAAEHRAAVIAVGHTADDVVETTVMHLVRGTGVEGLVGLEPRQPLANILAGEARETRSRWSAAVVRPLLELRRADTARYCQRRGLDWRADPTNVDPTFARNRIRHHLLPVLRTYNPSFDLAVLRLTRILREESREVERISDRAWRRLARPGDRQVEFSRSAFLRLRPAIRRRLLRRAVATLVAAGREVGFDAIQRADEVAMGRRSRTQLGHGLSLSSDGDRLRLSVQERA